MENEPQQENFEDVLFKESEPAQELKPVERERPEIDPTDLGLPPRIRPGEREKNLSSYFGALRKERSLKRRGKKKH